MDARMEAIELAVQAIAQTLANAGLGNNERLPQLQPNPMPRNQEERTIRIEIHDFDGQTTDPGVYLEWEASLERYFEYKDTPPERQYK
jgi:hypothetical protein